MNESAEDRLRFLDLAARHSGVTGAVAAYLAEAAVVCLDRHHVSPVAFDVERSNASSTALAEWAGADERTRAAHANETDATESGACALALAAVELATGMVAIRRAETRTGADYYVGPSDESRDDLEGCLRLEVSGVDHGNEASVARRMKEKLEQAARGASNLPAIATVVGFKAKLITVRRLGADDLGRPT